MHIERLELKNYAGFADFTLDFPKGNLCVLIGENGSGKTSILDAIQALFFDLKGNLSGNFLLGVSLIHSSSALANCYKLGKSCVTSLIIDLPYFS